MQAADPSDVRRFAPAAPSVEVIKRHHLSEVLAGRFLRRLTVLRAGAGFGKTTLLHQALTTEASAGIDLWLDLGGRAAAHSNITELLRDRLWALAESHGTPIGLAADVADAVWQLAPTNVALVMDNLHAYRDQDELGSMLERLLSELPTNGHLVLSSRREPPLKYRRSLATGEAVLIDENDLSFDSEAIARFAAIRGVDPSDLGDTGWPALLELRASAGTAAEREYIAEEVLAALGEQRLDAVAKLALLGRFDDRMVRAVTGSDARAADLADGLPLTSRAADGSIVLHDMWATLLPALPHDVEVEVLATMADELRGRDQLPTALSLYARAGRVGAARELLRPIACDYALRYGLSERRQMLAAVPAELQKLPETELIRADLVFAATPSASVAMLESAQAAAREAGDCELELQALLRLAEVQYRSDDNAGLASIADRVQQLARSDLVAGRAVLALIGIWRNMSSDSYSAALDLLCEGWLERYAPTKTIGQYYRAVLPGLMGHAQASLEALDQVIGDLHGRHGSRAAGHRSIMRFYLGDLDQKARDDVWRLVETIKEQGHVHLFIEGACTCAIYNVVGGSPEDARHQLEQAVDAAAGFAQSSWAHHMVSIAEATLAAFDGDETKAARILDDTMPAGGPFDGLTRHVYYNIAGLVYLLVPRSRPHWDADDCGPAMRLARDVGRAMVALREHSDTAPAAALDWSKPHRLRTWAIEPHLAELAVAALSAGNETARGVLSELRHDPHKALTFVGDRHAETLSQSTGALLVGVPRRPTEVVELSVLGPTVLRTGATSTTSAQMRRRVRELLHILVDGRRVQRSRVLGLLWPTLDRPKALNNLRVNLNHLNRLLEPHRAPNEAPWHVRRDNECLMLAQSRLLRIDADVFDDLRARAARAEKEGSPGDAVENYLRACALYRGDYLVESTDFDIGFEERERHRISFTAAATRCSE
ncbi:MAG: hypothetical protein KDB16_00660, partial [Acidimicrobiales bacterium]|nr:hypothetical protein [Acidimicrobiales bacterium]